MNINDFNNPTEIPQDILAAIFERQKELMEKYHHIEFDSGLMQTEECPVNLHSKGGQARLKDFSWRVTEELMEALEAWRKHDKDHFEEELVDALHFLVEQHILAGIEPADYVKSFPNLQNDPLTIMYQMLPPLCSRRVPELMVDMIERVGLAMNCLKNKPWKQTHMLTDVQKFKSHMVWAMHRYIVLVREAGIYPVDLYNLYFRKSKVNSFRVSSKY